MVVLQNKRELITLSQPNFIHMSALIAFGTFYLFIYILKKKLHVHINNRSLFSLVTVALRVKTVKSLTGRDRVGENIASRVFHDPISYNVMRAS